MLIAAKPLQTDFSNFVIYHPSLAGPWPDDLSDGNMGRVFLVGLQCLPGFEFGIEDDIPRRVLAAEIEAHIKVEKTRDLPFKVFQSLFDGHGISIFRERLCPVAQSPADNMLDHFFFETP
jgi:hypothetical protein